jgi:hypothetical protein
MELKSFSFSLSFFSFLSFAAAAGVDSVLPPAVAEAAVPVALKLDCCCCSGFSFRRMVMAE